MKIDMILAFCRMIVLQGVDTLLKLNDNRLDGVITDLIVK
jgi:hypothetical protein